jgi:hypothetical protein
MPVTFKKATKRIIHAHVEDDVEEKPANEIQDLDVRIKATRIEFVPIDRLKPNPRNAKKHPSRQIALLVENYEQFGVTQPILVDAPSSAVMPASRRHRRQNSLNSPSSDCVA